MIDLTLAVVGTNKIATRRKSGADGDDDGDGLPASIWALLIIFIVFYVGFYVWWIYCIVTFKLETGPLIAVVIVGLWSPGFGVLLAYLLRK